jgi:hypothetical protein
MPAVTSRRRKSSTRSAAPSDGETMLNRPTVPRPVVSREQWLAAPRALLAGEKAATMDFVRRHDAHDTAAPAHR